MHRYGPVFFGGAKTRSQTVSGCGTVANLPRDNLPAVRVKLPPLIRKCGDSESRLATMPAEQLNATSHCQPIGSPCLPSFNLVGWDVRLLQFDGFLYRCRNPGWCQSGQPGSIPTDDRAFELFKNSLQSPQSPASARNGANCLVSV